MRYFNSQHSQLSGMLWHVSQQKMLNENYISFYCHCSFRMNFEFNTVEKCYRWYFYGILQTKTTYFTTKYNFVIMRSHKRSVFQSHHQVDTNSNASNILGCQFALCCKIATTSSMGDPSPMSSQATILHQNLLLWHQKKIVVLVWKDGRTMMVPVLGILHFKISSQTTKKSCLSFNKIQQRWKFMTSCYSMKDTTVPCFD